MKRLTVLSKSVVNNETRISFHYKRKVRTVKISAGSRDSYYLFKEDKDIIVLTMNESLDYAGIEVFEPIDFDCDNNPIKCGIDQELFCQSVEQINEIMDSRKEWSEYSPTTIAKAFYYHWCNACR